MRHLCALQIFTISLTLSSIACAQQSSADLPLANPARPTIATPATLTPVGYLQFENGALYGDHSPEFTHRFSITQVTKLTVDPRLQFIVLSEPLTHATGAEVNGNRPGEVFAGAQAVILPGGGRRPTVSLSYIGRLHSSPAPEFDLGTFRNSGTFLLSEDLFGFHADFNVIELEQVEDGRRRGQHAQTLAVSHPVGKVTISTELWHFTQPFTRSNAVGTLWAASIAPKRNLVLDAGFDRGLTSTSTRWEAFVGATWVLPYRFFRGRGD